MRVSELRPPTIHIHNFYYYYKKSKMMRTKNGVRRSPACPQAKSPRALPLKKDTPTVPQPHRSHPSTRARMEIRKWR